MVKALLHKLLNNNNDVLNPRTQLSKEWIEKVREAGEYTPDASQLEKSEYQLLFVCEGLMIGRVDHEIIKSVAEYKATAFTRHNFACYKRNADELGIPLEAWAKGSFYTHGLMGGNRQLNQLTLRRQISNSVESKDKDGKVFYTLPETTYETTNAPADSTHTRIPGKLYAPVKGEIYSISSQYFSKTLDKFKENGKLFFRRRVPIMVKGTKTWKTSGSIIRQPYSKQVVCWMYVANPNYWINHIDAGYAYSKANCIYYDDFEEDHYITKRYYTYNEF